ncbi:hypothetical protein MKW92_041545, partial [Papaver armeniacum]
VICNTDNARARVSELLKQQDTVVDSVNNFFHTQQQMLSDVMKSMPTDGTGPSLSGISYVQVAMKAALNEFFDDQQAAERLFEHET